MKMIAVMVAAEEPELLPTPLQAQQKEETSVKETANVQRGMKVEAKRRKVETWQLPPRTSPRLQPRRLRWQHLYCTAQKICRQAAAVMRVTVTVTVKKEEANKEK